MSGGAYVEALTVSKVLAWDPRPAVNIGAKISDKAQKLDDETAKAASAIDMSYEYWKRAAGNAARDRAAQDRDHARRTKQVMVDIQQEIYIQLDAIVGYIDVIKEAKRDAENSEYHLYVEDDGEVRSRMPNWKVVLEHGPAGLVEKEGYEFYLTSRIRGALTSIQQTDKEGGEKVRRHLESLSPEVQQGATPMPSDPRLAEILTKYQTAPSKSGATLWPSGLLLNEIRMVSPDFQPTFMTPEEVALLELQLTKPDGINRVTDFFDFKSQAEEAAKKAYDNNAAALNDGHGDAFRHMYWNALMTQRYGEDWTQSFGTAHEGIGGNAPAREAMDLYNNSLGRQISVEHPGASTEELQRLVQQQIDAGDAIVINQQQQIEWSNRVKVGETGSPEPSDIPLPAGK
ncbi:hypothetical protein [Nocardia sp. NPDC005998]|uniref:DUF6973 domain-containing protein n=1 Tax=Nocardia sp. NPDC005998 TaxID=3156894 RepID=UPI0033BFA9DD